MPVACEGDVLVSTVAFIILVYGPCLFYNIAAESALSGDCVNLVNGKQVSKVGAFPGFLFRVGLDMMLWPL